jgi:hypothetical protein
LFQKCKYFLVLIFVVSVHWWWCAWERKWTRGGNDEDVARNIVGSPVLPKMVHGDAILISQVTDGASDGTSHPPSPQFPELIFIDAHPFAHLPANQWGSEMLRRELDKVLAGTALSVGPTFPPSDSAASSGLAAPGLIATAGWGTENEKKYSY